MDIRSLLGKELLFFDGGMGTLLQARGLQPGEEPVRWNLEHPDVIQQIHKAYYDAGCNIVETCTFTLNEFNYPEADGPYCIESLAAAAVNNAKTARDLANAEKPHFIAFSLGPLGKLLEPLGTLPFEEAYRIFARTIRAAEAAGADLIMLETFNDLYEMKAAVLAAKENCSLPVFASMTYSENARLMTGGDVPAEVGVLEGLGVDALGINCGLGPVQMKPIVLELLKYTSLPVIVNPNAGIPHTEDCRTVFDVGPEEFASVMKEMVEAGVLIAGGCCGTTPAHIQALTESCKDIAVKPAAPKNFSIVCGTSRTVFIGNDTILIGERINPTGKKKFKEALRAHDLEYIVREGIKQQDAGAHVLDVNVGLPEIDEAQMMYEVVRELQSVIGLPLQIDTSDPVTMEKALRIYNGKPLINSVNGKTEVMASVFPLVKKYGGVVVALVLDEDGIPATTEGRIAVAEKIYRTAESYGISRKDILVDGLVMTISSDQSSAMTALETIRRIRDDYQGNTLLGVSNISFGLPRREIINSVFFAMALQNGLSAAIINPGSEDMMRAWYAARALMGQDAQCLGFIGRYAGTTADAVSAPVGNVKTAESGAETLKDCVIRGLKESAGKLVSDLLKDGREALSVIDDDLVPALDVVGKRYESGEMFLPQLLMSADAAGAAFNVIGDHLARSGTVRQKKAKIVLATVKGDVHDIGKNIVKALLDNYNYDVIDLGKDVPPEVIVSAVKEHGVRYVGLCALMTTTVPAMEETIRLLRQVAPECKVLAGGAVMTQTYADQIGADAYCKDAMAAVKYLEESLGSL